MPKVDVFSKKKKTHGLVEATGGIYWGSFLFGVWVCNDPKLRMHFTREMQLTKRYG